MRNKKGFTIIELIVIIIVLGIIFGILIKNIYKTKEEKIIEEKVTDEECSKKNIDNNKLLEDINLLKNGDKLKNSKWQVINNIESANYGSYTLTRTIGGDVFEYYVTKNNKEICNFIYIVKQMNIDEMN